MLGHVPRVGATSRGCSSDEESTFNGGASEQSADDDSGCSGFGCTTNEGGKPGCVGLECRQVPCEGGAKTTVTGTVFDPAGKVPVFNATVYVPNADLADIPAGASGCDRCDAKVSGRVRTAA